MLLPVTSCSLCNVMSKTSLAMTFTFWSGVFMITTDFSSHAHKTSGRCCHAENPRASLPPCTRSGRVALISVALVGIIWWRIGEVKVVCSRTRNLSDSSLMESLVSGVKDTLC